MEESEDSSIDPFAGLPCGPPASLTPLTEEELLRGIRDILPEYQEHSNFRNVREMNAAMEHFERMKRYGVLKPMGYQTKMQHKRFSRGITQHILFFKIS